MRYAKELEPDTLVRDAALVADLHARWEEAQSPRNEAALRAAQDWFTKKHECPWREHVKTEERQR